MKNESKEFYELKTVLLNIVKNSSELADLFCSVGNAGTQSSFMDGKTFYLTTRTQYTGTRIRVNGKIKYCLFTVEFFRSNFETVRVKYRGNVRMKQTEKVFDLRKSDLHSLIDWERKMIESKKAVKLAKPESDRLEAGLKKIVLAASVEIVEILNVKFAAHYERKGEVKSTEEVAKEVQEIVSSAASVLAKRILSKDMNTADLTIEIKRVANDTRGRFEAVVKGGGKFFIAYSILAWGMVNAPHYRYLSK